MKNALINKYLDDMDIPYQEDVQLSTKTWIKTGGICSYWISPNAIEQLIAICRYFFSNGIYFDLVGQTSNLFFHSSYNPQVIISTVKINNYSKEGDVLVCECGCKVVKVAKAMLDEGYSGFCGLVGLPGTVASAAVNNAGCFSCSISSLLISAEVLMPDGLIKTFYKEDFCYKKRSSVFKCKEVFGVVLTLKLGLVKADDIVKEKLNAENSKMYRKTRQEMNAKNLGSVFSNMMMKKNVKNILAVSVSKIIGVTGISNRKLFYKRMLLGLYGYQDLSPYISDRQLNTFVWRDKEAEMKFVRYKQFMNEVFDDLLQEIEEKY